jgi:Raf kinase inhibitor-like YbhB/YbcL family protein
LGELNLSRLYNLYEHLILTRLFSRNACLALAIVPVLSLLSAQSLARDPRISGAPVGHLQGARPVTFAISSPSFSNGGKIPTKFTSDGTDVSPELTWTAPPPGTQSFTVIADDPDAPLGTWTHWLLFNLPAHTATLPEGVTKVDDVPSGGRQGRNDFRKIGYGGPCPPPGKPHRYFFKLYALDKMLNLKPGASKQDVEQAMQGHILAKAELMGAYQR